ncbi:MAG: hypothetical protein ABFR95_05555 [Actinomycetota bacterium]
MQLKQRTASLMLLGTMVAFLVIGLGTPAHGEVIDPGCTGSVTFTGGPTVTESQSLDDVVIVPEADTVQYTGSINIDPPSEPVEINGGIDVRLPFGGWTVVSWPGTTELTEASGTYAYTVPGFVPRGTGGLEVTATHTQQGETCKVAVTMALEGDPGPAALIGATGTIVMGFATLGAGIRKKVA